jgi:zinc D-Ala-D-Ala carboxypeptidase
MVLSLVLACQVMAAGGAAAFPWERPLQEGDHGRDVKALEVRIAGWFPRRDQTELQVDRIFDARTTLALKHWQRHFGYRDDGTAGWRIYKRFERQQDADRSTRHFDWNEFTQNYNAGCSKEANNYAGTFRGGMVGVRRVRRYVRRLMWRLEAIRAKAHGKPIGINSGFRSVAYNRCIGGATYSQHMYGAAADTRMARASNRRARDLARASQVHGIGCYATSTHNHFDVRIENEDLASGQYWWWPRQDSSGRDLDDAGRPCWGEGKAKAGAAAASEHFAEGRRYSPSAATAVPTAAEVRAFEKAGEPLRWGRAD